MGIDFHDKKNNLTYTTRRADETWIETIRNLVSIDKTTKALDIGCGGGIYSKALVDMGVKSVTGVDYSKAMLEGAAQNCVDYPMIFFKHGTALDTGLVGDSYQLVLERALIHHINDLHACFQEAYRMLKVDGYYLIQDRTPDDCILEGNETHIRGYFFECFPRLREIETARRHTSEAVIEGLKNLGFREIEEVKLWETRKVYENKKELLAEIGDRTGRSILHEITNAEMRVLLDYLDKSIATSKQIIEKDRWTIWKAVK